MNHKSKILIMLNLSQQNSHNNLNYHKPNIKSLNLFSIFFQQISTLTIIYNDAINDSNKTETQTYIIRQSCIILWKSITKRRQYRIYQKNIQTKMDIYTYIIQR
ncbi:hypothetical protein pb186bvf_006973 [Paramecium bursaria]